MTADVTVVIPTRDRVQLLDTTLRSALDQRGIAVEIVVVDDGSRDPGAIERLDSAQDPRVRLLRNARSHGVAVARNRGIEQASAPWVATLDDDDLWAPDKLARQLRAVRAQDRGWAFAGTVHFLPGPRAWHVGLPADQRRIRKRLPHDNLVPAGSSNVLVARELLSSVGGFDPDLPQLADWDLWCRLLREGPPATLDDVLVAYRLHENNMVLSSGSDLRAEVDVIERRTHDLRDGQPLDRTALHVWVATMNMRAGRRTEARRSYLRAVREGNPRLWWRVARTLVPIREIRSTVLRRSPPAWPPGVEEWLTAALEQQG